MSRRHSRREPDFALATVALRSLIVRSDERNPKFVMKGKIVHASVGCVLKAARTRLGLDTFTSSDLQLLERVRSKLKEGL